MINRDWEENAFEAAVEVGHFGESEEFQTGVAWRDLRFMDNLWLLFSKATFSLGRCEFCPCCGEDVICVTRCGDRIMLGEGQGVVYQSGGTVFVASDMVLHYVGKHHMQPSEEFVTAVKAWSGPLDKEYAEQLRRWGITPLEFRLSEEENRFLDEGWWPGSPKPFAVTTESMDEYMSGGEFR